MARNAHAREERFMLGAIVGDVIGSPFENHNVKSVNFRIFERGAQFRELFGVPV